MPLATTIKPEVQTVFDQYSSAIRDKLQSVRYLIYEVASEIEAVGELEETLKWGQPSYLPSKTKSGTTIRIDQVKDYPDNFALYVNCQTTLIDTFRSRYPELIYEGNRAIIFSIDEELPIDTLRECIGMILTYHLRKKPSRG